MRFYSFGPFCLDTANRSLLRGGESLRLQPKAYEILLILIENRNRLVTRTELLDSVWGDDVNVEKGALSYQIRQLRKILGDVAFKPQYIRTVPKVGFRFIANAEALSEIAELDDAIVAIQETGSNAGFKGQDSDHKIAHPAPLLGIFASSFIGYNGYVLAASAIYAAYFGVALLVEIAYEFDRYGPSAKWVALLISCFILLSSLLGLSLGTKRTFSGRRGGLLVSASVFAVAAVAVLVGACDFLPAQPITQADFQTFTAQAAYVKAFCYIVPLGLIFLVTPFHFIVAMERELQSRDPVLAVNLLTGMKPGAAPGGTVFLRTSFLLFLLVGMMAYSLIGRAHLFDNLKPGPYMSLFQSLIHVRMILYFSLAGLCLAWYYRRLNELKRDVLVGGLNPTLD
ncbi:MAG: winged helix-turn-helix domain-containing protein [Acidobacteriota bacterium]